jgi:hypothetical protein
VHLIAGRLLTGIEHAAGGHLAAGHPGAELLEGELATGQGQLQIDGAQIQPLQAQAAQLQSASQVHRLEGGKIRFGRGERLGGGRGGLCRRPAGAAPEVAVAGAALAG